MNLQNKLVLATIGVLLACGAAGCREDERAPERVLLPEGDGVFVLNEGKWNDNNASLDFWSERTGEYARGVFRAANPGAVLGLGDLGNDAGIHGGKLYVVVNGSNKMEVLDVHTGARAGTVPLVQPRYVAFAGGFAYVSAYGDSGNGLVAEVDTATLRVTRTVEVGRQPEEMAVVNGKLFVANSGGLAGSDGRYDYERTVSVIELDGFRRSGDIDVAINLHRLRADGDGNLYVSSRGDYAGVAPGLFVVDAGGVVVDSFDIPVSSLAIAGERAYVIGARYGASGGAEYSYHAIDTRRRALLDEGFVREGEGQGIVAPYCVEVHPVTGDIYVTDARSFDVAGRITRFSAAGVRMEERVTGVIPTRVVFRTLTAR
ncbi:MAG: YncE family protein [Odoribacteraceae bacterium]|jgi:YVTN family beta-propeller protein|nr:YncE family protein [Odoribacteraceae bacterium]